MRLRRRALETRFVPEARVDEGSEERELLALVREAVDVLPPRQRDAVLMHYLDGLSCEEIAVLVDSTPGAIRVQLHRARRALRKQLAPLAPPPRPKEEIRMIEMALEDVLVRVAEDESKSVLGETRVVLLKEAEGDRRLTIWIGAAEGNALALRLTEEATPRPVTSDVMAELVRVTGARIEHVAVTRLTEDTFYAVIAVAADGTVTELDARPSDALNLAVRLGAPVFVDEAVLETSALPEGDLGGQLDAEADRAGFELAEGSWSSLSGELLQSLYRWR